MADRNDESDWSRASPEELKSRRRFVLTLLVLSSPCWIGPILAVLLELIQRVGS